ncbi:MAG: glycosyltransferase family 9 protein [Candidatus Omnitrophica bacterium]|nr:glycosyltransferase family 9 protein [Candidatus Omnitrophota bacterium]
MRLKRPEGIQVLKFIDHWVGSPICAILGLFHRLTHPFYRVTSRIELPKDPRAILVIKFFGLGSILLSSSLLKNIKTRYPDTKIIFLTFKNNAELVRRLGISDEIRAVDVSGPFTTLYSVFNNLIYFSLHKPDISIDLEFFSKFGTMMSYLSGAKWRLGFYIAQFWRHSLVNVPVFFNYARHILEIYRMFGSAIGVNGMDTAPAAIPVKEERDFIDTLFSERGIIEEDLLMGVNVNASDLAYCRKYPIERFAEVINSLLKHNKELKVFLTGALSEKKNTASVFKFLEKDVKDRVFDLSGSLNLGQFLALLGRLNVFLTNDSGPFHLAKAQGIATVSIWGPGSPALYGPFDDEEKKNKVVYSRFPCSPCLYIYRTDAGYFCKGAAPCLNDISSEKVAKAVQQTIDEINKGGS